MKATLYGVYTGLLVAKVKQRGGSLENIKDAMPYLDTVEN